jgi:transaldolase
LPATPGRASAGCRPKLLEELAGDNSDLPRALSPDQVRNVAPIEVNEAVFRWEINANAMATEKLAEGIRNFHKDHAALTAMVADRLH